MANIMKEVANALGVELEEEFRIEGYTRRYKLSENGLEFWDDTCKDWCPASGLEEILTGVCKIIKPSESILNDAEKDYLSTVIKPFRDRVIWIKKIDSPTQNYEYIKICYQDHNYTTIVLDFPDFKVDAMYKGMETAKEYTLEELGL